jgi:hypothetical protein
MGPEMMAMMPPEAMQGMDADMMAAMPPEAMQGMDADMMAAMPPGAMEGMDADMMAAMPPGAMEGMDPAMGGGNMTDSAANPGMDGGMDALGAAFGAQGVEPMGAPPPGTEGDPMANMAATDPMGTAPPPGAEADPMAGLDAALGGAMDQSMDQGAGAGAPDMGVPPDAGTEAPMDAPDVPEPDMPPPPDEPIVG